MIKISVIIPIYNDEEFLRKCLDSVLHQSLKEIEIICINDGSTDSTSDILEEYQNLWNNLKIYTQDNKGVSSARNRGISLSRGEYIAFMDGDDYYPSDDVLEALYEAAKRAQVKICGGSCIEDTKGQINRCISGIRAPMYFAEEKTMSFNEYAFPNGFTRFIYSRKMLMEGNIKFPNVRVYEDPPFLAMAMIKGNVFHAINKEVYCYRVGIHKRIYSYQDSIDVLRMLKKMFRLAQKHKIVQLQYNCALLIQKKFEQQILPYYESKDKVFMNLIKDINDSILPELKNDKESLCKYLSMEEIEHTICEAEEEYSSFAEYIESSKYIIVFGAGTVGKYIIEIIRTDFKKDILGVAVTKLNSENEYVEGIKMTCIQEWAKHRDKASFIVAATGEKQIEMYNTLKKMDVKNIFLMNYNRLYCGITRKRLKNNDTVITGEISM